MNGMKVYWGKDRQSKTQRVKGVRTGNEDTCTWLQITLDNLFSAPKLFDDMTKKQI
jgi:hypothetical protein